MKLTMAKLRKLINEELTREQRQQYWTMAKELGVYNEMADYAATDASQKVSESGLKKLQSLKNSEKDQTKLQWIDYFIKELESRLSFHKNRKAEQDAYAKKQASGEDDNSNDYWAVGQGGPGDFGDTGASHKFENKMTVKDLRNMVQEILRQELKK